MKQCNKFLALFLALVMILSNANLGLTLAVSAAEIGEGSEPVTTGQLLEKNYGITGGEAEIIDAYLVSDTYRYNVPNNDDGDMITIGEGTVEVKDFENWTVSEVLLVPADGSENEVITLTDGNGTYAYDGNAFSIKVTYELYQNVEVAKQKLLLSAISELQRAQADLAAVESVSLDAVVMAMETLVDLAQNGVCVQGLKLWDLDPETVTAVNALNAQLTANNGKLDLQVTNEENKDVNKLQYMAEHGEEYQDLVADAHAKLAQILDDSVLFSDNVLKALEIYDNEKYVLLSAFQSVLADIVANLKLFVDASWNFDAVADGVDYDALADVITDLETTVVTAPIVEKLLVADTTLSKGHSMWNVTVNVEVWNWSAEEGKLVKVVLDKSSASVSLLDKTEQEDIQTAVVAMVGDLVAGKIGHHEIVSATEIPAILTEDFTYSVVYYPVKHNVVIVEGDAPVFEAEYFHNFVFELPANETAGMEYDYYYNGELRLAGDEIIVDGDKTITRETVKEYAHYSLYNVVAKNFGNDFAKTIVNSGLLLGDVDVRIQAPSIKDIEVSLDNGELTLKTGVAEVSANYAGLKWVLCYDKNGEWVPFENGTGHIDGDSTEYAYVLSLEDKFDHAAAMDRIANVKTAAVAQVDALVRLYGYYGDMSLLDSAMTSIMSGMVSNHNFVDAQGVAPADQAAVRAHFQKYLALLAPAFQNLVKEMGAADNTSLRNYYLNNAKMLAALETVCDALNGMLPDKTHEEYLESLFDQLKDSPTFSQYMSYKDKIKNLKTAMNEVQTGLGEPAEYLDLSNTAELGKLADLLEKNENQVEFTVTGAPTVETDSLIVNDVKYANVEITVTVDGKTETFTLDRLILVTDYSEDQLTQDDVDALKAKIETFINNNKKADLKYYEKDELDVALDSLVGNLTVTHKDSITYTLKQYSVTMNGEHYAYVTAVDLKVDLPKSDDADYVLKFYVNGELYTGVSPVEFTLEDLDNGTLAITSEYIHVDTDNFENRFEETESVKPSYENGKPVELNATIDPSQNGILVFAEELFLAGYETIYLNGEPLMEATQDGRGVLINLQTLINALVMDDSFGSQKLIELGLGNPMARNANNLFLDTTIQLGEYVRDENGTIVLDENGEAVIDEKFDLPFNLYLASAPSKLVELAEALNSVKEYFWFQSNGQQLEIHLELPDKVYEAYLVSALLSGYKTNEELTQVDMQIAYDYLCDIIALSAESNVTVDTFENTLAMVGIEKDLSKYAPYFNKLKALINAGAIEVVHDGDHVDVNTTAQGATIDELIAMLGIDLNDFTTDGINIRELVENGEIYVNGVASIDHAPNDYEAIIIDANAFKAGGKDMLSGFDFINNLTDRLDSVNASAIMLLDDIDGDLVFNGTTILDLNGMTVNGNIIANGNVYIMDSNLAADNCGTVTGTVTGNAAAIAGRFPGMEPEAVEAMLPDGYKYKDYVRHAIYNVEGDFENLNFVIDTDFMFDDSIKGYVPSVRALAADIVADLILNRYIYASLSYNDDVILELGLDNILDTLNGEEPAEVLINRLLSTIRVDNASAFTNKIIAKLLDFGAVAESIKKAEAIGSYKLTTNPWTVAFHNNNGQNFDFGICANKNVDNDLNMSLTFVGSNREKMVYTFEKLDLYVNASAELNLAQPKYEDGILTLGGDGFVMVDIDLTVNKQWQTVIAVIMAYGNPDEADKWVAAAAAGDENALRDLFNASTVEEVFTATKAMNHNVSFEAMAAELGLVLDVPGRESLEELFHLALCGFGKGLEVLNINGYTDKTMGMLETEYGVYELSVNSSKQGDVIYRGYGVDASTVLDTTGISIAIFDEQPVLVYGEITSKYWTMSLDSVVFLNYYVNLTGFDPNLDFATNGGVVVWTGDEYPTSRDQVQIGLENCDVIEGMFYDENYGWGVQSPEIYAKNLGDRVYLRAYVEIAEGVYVYGPVGFYSPEMYCKDMLDNSNEREDTRAVCAALLNYGASAQVYFGYKTDDLVTDGVDLSDYDLTFKADYLDAMDVPTKEMANTLTGIKSGISLGEATLNLQGAIRLDVGYTIDPSVIDWDKVASAEVLFWTEEAYNNADSLAYEEGNYVYKHALTEGDIDGVAYMVAQSHHILAKYLSDTVYFSARIVMEDGTVYRSGLGYYSPEQFVADHLAQSEGQIVTVCEHIAVYSEMARIRFAQ